MKNKKGFTLIELLCVILILAVISVIASVGVINLSKKSKDNLYCAKIALIETVARDYGVAYEKELNNSTELYEGHKSLKIKVSDLVSSGKLETDKEEMVINPKDNTSMNDVEIILYLNNNKIYAVIPNNVC